MIGIVHVVIDESTPRLIAGVYEFDRGAGGTLVIPAGTSFPASAVAGELFWRTDDKKFYRRDSTNATWEGVEATLDPVEVIEAFGSVMEEPSGFLVPGGNGESVISKVDGTRTFSIAPTGASFDYYVKGVKYTVTTQQDVVWADTEGVHAFYFDDAGVLQETSSESILASVILGAGALVSYLYWDATNNVANFFAEERHGMKMDGATHLNLHETRGAQYISGGGLANFTVDGDGSLAAHAQFSAENTVLLDEDLELDTSGSGQVLTFPAEIPVYFRSGAAGDWRRKTSNTYPVVYSGTGGYTGANGRLPYNQWTGATWQLTELGQGQCVIVVYWATGEVSQPLIGLMGQEAYATVGAARAAVATEYQRIAGMVRLLAKEAVPLGAVIFQTSTTYTNTPKARLRAVDAAGATYVDLRIAQSTGGTSVPVINPVFSDGAFRVYDDGDLTKQVGFQCSGVATATTRIITMPDNDVNLSTDQAASTGSLRTLGTGVLQACAGNDSRLSDARTPTAHASSHNAGGSDALTIDAAAGTGSLRTLGTSATSACAGNDSRLSDARTPTAHASTHNAGGADALAIDAAAGTGSLRTLGTSATSACAGNDSRLSNARTPTAHASTHNAGGADALVIDAAAGTGSLRTLGTAATAACAGNDSRLSDARAPTGTASGDLGGSYPSPTVVDLTITGEAQGDILYRNGTNWVRLPAGTSGYYLKTNGAAANPAWAAVSGTGDVVGPSSATDNAVARYDTTTGKLIQNSTVTIDDNGNLRMNADGSTTSAPRIFGATGFNAAGEALRWEFGDAYNAVQNAYGGAMSIGSYHTLILRGDRNSLTEMPWDTTSDIGVWIPNTVASSPALVVDGASGQTADLAQYRDSAGTVLWRVTSAGNTNLGNHDLLAIKAASHNSVIAHGSMGATETFDWSTGMRHSATNSATCTITFTAPPGPCNLMLVLTNGGAYTLTWPAAVKWAGGAQPTWTASGVDVVAFFYDGTNYYGVASLNFA